LRTLRSEGQRRADDRDRIRLFHRFFGIKNLILVGLIDRWPVGLAADVHFIWPFKRLHGVARQRIDFIEHRAAQRSKIAARIENRVEANTEIPELDPSAVEHVVVIGVLQVNAVAQLAPVTKGSVETNTIVLSNTQDL